MTPATVRSGSTPAASLAAACPGDAVGFSPVDAAAEAELDTQILRDISPYYGELECGFTATHLPRIGTVVPSPGFSTLAKLAWAILDGGRVIGKAVCTVKRSGAWKVGPIAVMPSYRNRGHASACLASIVQHAHSHRWSTVVATVPQDNLATQRLFARLGFRVVGVLEDHYRVGCVEDVMVCDAPATGPWRAIGEAPMARAVPEQPLEYLCRYVADRFFPVDDRWRRWLAVSTSPELGNFAGKPHDVVHRGGAGTALVIYKRGGTAKVVPVVDGAMPVAPEVVAACEHAALRRARRKAAMFLPVGTPPPRGYRCELVAERYALRGPIAVWSRWLA